MPQQGSSTPYDKNNLPSIETTKGIHYLHGVIAALITIIVILAVICVILIWKSTKENRMEGYLPINKITNSKHGLKQSPVHEPEIIKKSTGRQRVFSSSKSRSRSKCKGVKDDCSGSSCFNNADHFCTSLNNSSPDTSCSSGGIDNLTHNGVMLDLEDCCQMTICDTVSNRSNWFTTT